MLQVAIITEVLDISKTKRKDGGCTMFVTYYPEGNYFVMFYDVFASVTYIIISFSSTLDGG